MKNPTRMPAAQPLARGEDLRDRGALVHRVEHALAAALGADPGLAQPALASACAMRSLMRSARVWMVNGIDAAAGRAALARTPDPVDAEAEDVVGEPDVIGLNVRFRWVISAATSAGAALQVLVAPDRLRAPGAAERAAARGRHVEAEVAMRAAPEAAGKLDVHEVPRRQLGLLRVGDGTTPLR